MRRAIRSLRPHVPGFVKQRVAAIRFAATKYLFGFRVPATPFLDGPGLLLFRDVLSRTSRYLEYGAGASTLAAWQAADVVVAVESDSRMLAAVRRALSAARRSPGLSRLIHADIGLTRSWGRPAFTRPTKARLARWENYAKAPWEFLQQHAIAPDTILIDGRFRVACALQSLLNLSDGSPCLLLIDDYGDRPHYRGVEEFADLVAMHGRMAVFRKKGAFDAEKCRQALHAFNRDWR